MKPVHPFLPFTRVSLLACIAVNTMLVTESARLTRINPDHPISGHHLPLRRYFQHHEINKVYRPERIRRQSGPATLGACPGSAVQLEARERDSNRPSTTYSPRLQIAPVLDLSTSEGRHYNGRRENHSSILLRVRLLGQAPRRARQRGLGRPVEPQRRPRPSPRCRPALVAVLGHPGAIAELTDTTRDFREVSVLKVLVS
jgi:hypothetical protein